MRVENKRGERECSGWGRIRGRMGEEDKAGGGGDENRSERSGIIAHIQDNISLFSHVYIFATPQLCVPIQKCTVSSFHRIHSER